MAFLTGVDARKLGEVLREAHSFAQPREGQSLGRSLSRDSIFGVYAAFAYSFLTVRVYVWSGAGASSGSGGVEPILVTATASKQELSATLLLEARIR